MGGISALSPGPIIGRSKKLWHFLMNEMSIGHFIITLSLINEDIMVFELE